MIRLENLTKQFKQKNGKTFNAVDNINLYVPTGEICVFLGPSGCGKTTTLKMVNRLIQPSNGKIFINGQDTSELDVVTLRRQIGYVIQQIGLFPNMTIEENIMIVPHMLGWDKKKTHERASELMNMVALNPKHYLKRYPKELSGGQQQRIGVIRALAADAPLMLMDEPFGAVDPINRETIQNEFLEMQKQLKKTILLVSHDIDEALKLADRIAVFHQGKIIQKASPDELLAKPNSEFVASFVGQDRTLKRLLLVNASDVTDQQEAFTVYNDTSLSDAYHIMDEQDLRAITVIEHDNTPLGYITRRDARNAIRNNDGSVCEDKLQTFKVTAKADDNLRVVLSKLYQHDLVWMPILNEDGKYSGEISQDYIANYLSSGKTRRSLAEA